MPSSDPSTAPLRQASANSLPTMDDLQINQNPSTKSSNKGKLSSSVGQTTQDNCDETSLCASTVVSTMTMVTDSDTLCMDETKSSLMHQETNINQLSQTNLSVDQHTHIIKPIRTTSISSVNTLHKQPDLHHDQIKEALKLNSISYRDLFWSFIVLTIIPGAIGVCAAALPLYDTGHSFGTFTYLIGWYGLLLIVHWTATATLICFMVFTYTEVHEPFNWRLTFILLGIVGVSAIIGQDVVLRLANAFNLPFFSFAIGSNMCMGCSAIAVWDRACAMHKQDKKHHVGDWGDGRPECVEHPKWYDPNNWPTLFARRVRSMLMVGLGAFAFYLLCGGFMLMFVVVAGDSPVLQTVVSILFTSLSAWYRGLTTSAVFTHSKRGGWPDFCFCCRRANYRSRAIPILPLSAESAGFLSPTSQYSRGPGTIENELEPTNSPLPILKTQNSVRYTNEPANDSASPVKLVAIPTTGVQNPDGVVQGLQKTDSIVQGPQKPDSIVQGLQTPNNVDDSTMNQQDDQSSYYKPQNNNGSPYRPGGGRRNTIGTTHTRTSNQETPIEEQTKPLSVRSQYTYQKNTSNNENEQIDPTESSSPTVSIRNLSAKATINTSSSMKRSTYSPNPKYSARPSIHISKRDSDMSAHDVYTPKIGYDTPVTPGGMSQAYSEGGPDEEKIPFIDTRVNVHVEDFLDLWNSLMSEMFMLYITPDIASIGVYLLMLGYELLLHLYPTFFWTIDRFQKYVPGTDEFKETMTKISRRISGIRSNRRASLSEKHISRRLSDKSVPQTSSPFLKHNGWMTKQSMTELDTNGSPQSQKNRSDVAIQYSRSNFSEPFAQNPNQDTETFNTSSTQATLLPGALVAIEVEPDTTAQHTLEQNSDKTQLDWSTTSSIVTNEINTVKPSTNIASNHAMSNTIVSQSISTSKSVVPVSETNETQTVLSVVTPIKTEKDTQNETEKKTQNDPQNETEKYTTPVALETNSNLHPGQPLESPTKQADQTNDTFSHDDSASVASTSSRASGISSRISRKFLKKLPGVTRRTAAQKRRRELRVWMVEKLRRLFLGTAAEINAGLLFLVMFTYYNYGNNRALNPFAIDYDTFIRSIIFALISAGAFFFVYVIAEVWVRHKYNGVSITGVGTRFIAANPRYALLSALIVLCVIILDITYFAAPFEAYYAIARDQYADRNVA